jgi:hypothetical protein
VADLDVCSPREEDRLARVREIRRTAHTPSIDQLSRNYRPRSFLQQEERRAISLRVVRNWDVQSESSGGPDALRSHGDVLSINQITVLSNVFPVSGFWFGWYGYGGAAQSLEMGVLTSPQGVCLARRKGVDVKVYVPKRAYATRASQGGSQGRLCRGCGGSRAELSGMSSARCVDSLQALGARTSCPMKVGLGANFEFAKCRRR